MYDSLYGLVSTSTLLRLTQRTVKTGTSIYHPRPTSATSQRSSSCNLRLYPHQLPATIVQLHFNNSIIPATDITHLAEDKYNCHGLYTHVCNSDNKLSFLLYLLPRLCFLHCLWLSLLARFNLKHLRGRRAYRLRNSLRNFFTAKTGFSCLCGMVQIPIARRSVF